MQAGEESDDSAGGSTDEEEGGDSEASAQAEDAPGPRPDQEAVPEGVSELGDADLDLLESLNIDGETAHLR